MRIPDHNLHVKLRDAVNHMTWKEAASKFQVSEMAISRALKCECSTWPSNDFRFTELGAQMNQKLKNAGRIEIKPLIPEVEPFVPKTDQPKGGQQKLDDDPDLAQFIHDCGLDGLEMNDEGSVCIQGSSSTVPVIIFHWDKMPNWIFERLRSLGVIEIV